MPSQEFRMTDNGGIEFVMTDENGDERAILLEPNDDGTIDIQGRGPNGTSNRGTIAPGEGSNPLGK